MYRYLHVSVASLHAHACDIVVQTLLTMSWEKKILVFQLQKVQVNFKKRFLKTWTDTCFLKIINDYVLLVHCEKYVYWRFSFREYLLCLQRVKRKLFQFSPRSSENQLSFYLWYFTQYVLTFQTIHTHGQTHVTWYINWCHLFW